MFIPAAFAESLRAIQPHPLAVYSSQASLVPLPTSLQMYGVHADIPGEPSPALLLYLRLSEDRNYDDLFPTTSIDEIQ